MVKFDEQIRWYRKRLELAQEDIRDLGSGVTHFLNDKDMTPELMDRAKRNADLFGRLIDAYEKKNA